MAEAVLFSLATNILNTLATEMVKPGGTFASQKIRLLCGAKDELQSLGATVQTIQAVLLDAEKKQWHNNQVKLWLKRLKDVLYDIEDLVDEVATKDLRLKVTPGNETWKAVRVFFSKSNQFVHRLEVANKIQKLRKTLDSIKEDRKFLLEEHPSEETMAIGRGKKHEFVTPDEKIIGRGEDKEKIKKLLFDCSPSQDAWVVSIVGKGGIGKTALARLVYNDVEVKQHFELKMWVCVSDDFDVERIIKEILESGTEVSEREFENKPIDQLQRLLRKTLGGKKYLLVLDDMWNEVRLQWLALGDWLNNGVRGSKILVTTRSETVAKVTDEKSVIINLGGLSNNESWDLFREVAFGDRQALVDPRLEEMGREIVRKCGGVPLAVRTIGSLLYGKNEDQWNRYKEKELPELAEVDAVGDGIMQVLKFSYDHLPSRLKHCFAYCSLFPKDCIYWKNEMICLWMAQGFIESVNGEDNLEEVAGNYLSELFCRSFLDVETKDDNGEVLTFKMHDLMHDLAQIVAGDECRIVNFKEREFNVEIRHVSFLSKLFSQEKMVSLLQTSKLRTFLYLEVDGLKTEPSILDSRKVIFGLRHCRALSLSDIDIPIHVSLFEKLKHLRLLDVSRNQFIESLPDSITDLVNLQTLDLSGCAKLTTLPRDLRKLVNLRHLIIDECESLSHMPRGLNHLSSLQTLTLFIVQKMDHRVPGGVGSLDELGGLNKLAGSITLQNLEFLQPIPNKGHLMEKQHLRCLSLKWSHGQQDEKSENDELILWENLRPHPNLTNLDILRCQSRSPPSWLSSIVNLVELTLSECGEWKHLPPMGELPSLRELTLDSLNALEFVQEISDESEQSDITRPFFPSLERMSLDSCENLKGWWGKQQMVGVDQDHWLTNSHSKFPKLLYVRIENCPHLNSLPLFPRIEDLILQVASGKLLKLQATAFQNYQSKAGESTFIPLSKLENLSLDIWEDLEHSTLEMLLPLLTNLKSMDLEYCNSLRSLSQGMQYLSSLLSLKIADCYELDLSSHDDEHGTQWRSLTKLRDLSFRNLPKLVALPKGIQHVTTLESLKISWCHNLTGLPEWIGNLSSLKALTIELCRGVTCLPDGVSRLTSLKELTIYGCPVLNERCRRETGEDWEKIASLPCSREQV